MYVEVITFKYKYLGLRIERKLLHVTSYALQKIQGNTQAFFSEAFLSNFSFVSYLCIASQDGNTKYCLSVT